MSVVIYTNRRNGCRYAYESTYRWDPEKGQSRPTRRYLGRVDGDGNIIPSSHRRGGARTKGPLTLAREAQGTAAAEAAEVAQAAEAGGAPADELRACRERVRALEAEVASLSGMIGEIRAIVSRPGDGSE